MVRDALHDVSPAGFIVLRFAIGTAALAPFAARRRTSPVERVPARTFLAVTVALGVALTAGYLLQTVGLQYTDASSSAFITGLFVVFTALIEVVLGHDALRRSTGIAVVLAVVGLFLITGATVRLNVGDLLTLGCAFAFAVQIAILGRWSGRFDPFVLNTAQMAVLTVLTLPALAVTGPGALTARAWTAIVVTGLACSALAFTLQVYGQRHAPATRSALLLSLEPVFATVTAYATGNGLGALGAVGAAVILAAIVVEERATA
jgi:drug/metabolite transporter (DMT)-like permease